MTQGRLIVVSWQGSREAGLGSEIEVRRQKGMRGDRKEQDHIEPTGKKKKRKGGSKKTY